MPTTYRPKVYTASKLHHYVLWKKMRDDMDWDFVDFTASWVDFPTNAAEVGHLDTDDPEQPSAADFRDGWLKNIADIKRADFVLLYAGRENALKGALVECGVAIGLGIPVLAVGITSEHTWTYHPLVHRFSSLREARQYLYRFTTMIPKRKKGTSDASD
jgi:hypothetical protein